MRLLMLGACLAALGAAPALARTHHPTTSARYAGHAAARHAAHRRAHPGRSVAADPRPRAGAPFVDQPPSWQDDPSEEPGDGSGPGDDQIPPPGSAEDNPATPV